MLKGLIEQRKSKTELIDDGFDRDEVEKVARLLRFNEYKRRQAAPGAKISAMSFGRDRRFPLTNRFDFEKP
jgi:NH3-dependent NAD+ synthetase